MNKNTFSFLAFFCALILFSQDKTIELPLIGDRLSGAVSETEEEIAGEEPFLGFNFTIAPSKYDKQSASSQPKQAQARVSFSHPGYP